MNRLTTGGVAVTVESTALAAARFTAPASNIFLSINLQTRPYFFQLKVLHISAYTFM